MLNEALAAFLGLSVELEESILGTCLCCLVGGKGRFFWALLFVFPPFDAFDALRIVS